MLQPSALSLALPPIATAIICFCSDGAGTQELAHGRANADHCHLRQFEHAVALGIPLHSYQLLHQAGRLQAILP